MNIFLILHFVLFPLFFILILCTKLQFSTKSLVESSMSWVTIQPLSVVWNKSRLGRLLRERFCCSKSKNVWNESAVLSYNLTERLILHQNFTIQSGIFFSWNIFLSFVRILSITYTVHISEWLGRLPVIKTTGSINEWSKCMRSFLFWR